MLVAQHSSLMMTVFLIGYFVKLGIEYFFNVRADSFFTSILFYEGCVFLTFFVWVAANLIESSFGKKKDSEI